MSVKIGVILGTVRKPALGEKIFKYLRMANSDTSEVEFSWIDLKDFPLPLYDHQETPLEDQIQDLNKNESAWLKAIEEVDGYVILTPEYDHAITGALKNALDFIGQEVARKPVQIISYSHFSDGGMLAAQSLVPILQMLNMIVLPTPALIWNADPNFTEDGQLVKKAENSDHFEKRLAEVFHEIIFYTTILKENPYK